MEDLAILVDFISIVSYFKLQLLTTNMYQD